ncbi:winged helix-turn-helix transcriptional regulator [Actinoplanes awajinensis]|uniref:Cinnamoyl ester hydrolase n=1 Tax=Actinoplanes awajinensis subsp. mycoplanecinus TaxID=135947 RepID=A0A0X3V6U7_9ACTN|nr:helix-turn-helix domain-containing protein [Actinoplanes awajinensis]KUL39952.1 cinnamoyl ester hydrolase [Actinoplanes awajinensis subsp. mycoplanecinus]
MTSTCATGEHDKHDVFAELCPCRGLLDLIANKWTTLAVGALENGPLRFGALQRHMEGISPKVLTQTLRRMEDAGLLTRTVYPAVPLHVEYELTPLGASLILPLRGLRDWAETHLHDLTI